MGAAARAGQPPKKKVDSAAAWREFRELVWVHRRRLTIGLTLMMISRLSGIVLPALSKYVIDDVIGKGRHELLVPIAMAYHLAHYFTYLLIQGQLLIRLASDPLGFGWNLFGTARYRPDIGIVGARAVWYTAVVAIVVGHVLAVYVAHVVALREYRDRRAALRSQLPMLVLMVGYTVVSLWIIAQPIVESR